MTGVMNYGELSLKLRDLKNDCARNRTRTCMRLLSLDPEPKTVTNLASERFEYLTISKIFHRTNIRKQILYSGLLINC
jgi:hypothetical protein